ncbi:carbohydrate kinase family protein [Microlunatus antarcticus]|uniref:Sugar/nucleoside kinase (Ribokinase family) n=1 Tax=Microlunatus antarcticus TaxID=53388 RepID=A0A7W5JZG6_9ACTN|nr:carbohydrate kinase family protein [Microlunatus antarcticus]MBB3329103.1 sugar/nucleoside kinase (ribokinase family) [Microlunatus antarcticus]
MDVLVVGDANPDLVLAGNAVPRFGQAEQLLDRADLVLGGSAGIMAAGLARLDVATGLAAVVGEDAFGDLVLTRLAERGVDVTTIARDPDHPTGLSVILLADDAPAADRAILTLPGTIPRLRADHVRASVEAHRPRHVHVASYFLQPALAAELPGLLAWLHDRGVSTSLDTNWDPAGRWAGLGRVLSLVDVFLPNEAEVVAVAAALGARTADPAEAAAALASAGCRVVVKQGAAGALSVAPEGAAASAVRVDAVPVEPRDSTGAGDSFDAGYVAALVSGVEDEAERLRWAAVTGALSTRASGGTASQAVRSEVVAV